MDRPRRPTPRPQPPPRHSTDTNRVALHKLCEAPPRCFELACTVLASRVPSPSGTPPPALYQSVANSRLKLAFVVVRLSPTTDGSSTRIMWTASKRTSMKLFTLPSMSCANSLSFRGVVRDGLVSETPRISPLPKSSSSSDSKSSVLYRSTPPILNSPGKRRTSGVRDGC